MHGTKLKLERYPLHWTSKKGTGFYPADL